MRGSKGLGLGLITAIYAIALLAGVGVADLIPGAHPLIDVLVADVVATVVVFAGSVALRNASVYDPYWSVAPIAIALYFLALPLEGAVDPVRPLVALLLVGAWGVRLTGHWATGWDGLSHEDWRYRDLRAKSGAAWPLVNLFGIHLMPTLMVYLGCLALWPAMTSPQPFGWIDAVGAVVAAGAIALETTADAQRRAFKATSTDPLAVLDSGVWGWSRHPNYLGEIGFWVGLWGLAAGTGRWGLATAVGWIAMVLLFATISIPLMERRQVERKPAYRDLVARVPPLLPWPRPRRIDR